MVNCQVYEQLCNDGKSNAGGVRDYARIAATYANGALMTVSKICSIGVAIWKTNAWMPKRRPNWIINGGPQRHNGSGGFFKPERTPPKTRPDEVNRYDTPTIL